MNKIFKKSLFISSILIFISTSLCFADIDVSRISGSNRYETAINVSKNNFIEANYVIIASGENYPDAIMGGALSTQTQSPILLVKKNYVSPEVIDEIKRISPNNIFALGGNATISNDTLFDIENKTNIPVRRVAGSNRFETATEINRLRIELHNLSYEDLEGITRHYYGAVSGYNFYDALYTAPYIGLRAFSECWVIRLSFCKNTVDFNTEDSWYGFVIGNVKEKNRNGAYYPEFIKGKNRYETSVLIAKSYMSILNLNFNTVVLTSGENYPDGLSAAGITATHKIPILLTPNYNLDPSVKQFLKDYQIKNVIIVGGEKSVSKGVENELKNLTFN